MREQASRIGAPEWLIIIGSGIFILTLGVSAVFVPEIRWLHVFQALIYVATILLSVSGSRWGHFVGISAAGLWTYLGAFASPLFGEFLREPGRPDLVLQVIAWVGNVLVVIGCLWAYSRGSSRSRSDAGRFIAAFVVATGYLAAAIAVFAPSYLRIFPAILHPHWPWVGG